MTNNDEHMAPVIPLFAVAPAVADEAQSADVRADAEAALLRKLRTRSLSVSEARKVLNESGALGADAEEIIDDCIRRGYLDDRQLAEALLRSGVERKGMGRAAVARTIAQRGIERSVIDEVLDSEPNDDAQRALDFARKKAASLGYLDREVAVRRLAGQLARRGFSASALSVASRAVDEARKPAGGVRFS
jgi:regulatory protein